VRRSTEISAIYLYHDSALEQIAHFRQDLPDGSGYLNPDLFPTPLLNEAGNVAFKSTYQSNVHNQTRNAIFVHAGTSLVKVAEVGQPLAGSVVTELDLGDLNDRMQIAYRAVLADGRQVIARFEPDNYWRGAPNGSWDSDADWSLRVDPTTPYNAFIIAENPLVVTGPAADASVHSLTLGGPNSAEAKLELQAGVRLVATDGVTVRPNGVLSGGGTIAGDITNAGGLVSPGSSPGVLLLEGDFLQDAVGRLLLEIAGPNAGTQYDVLDVTGSLLLDGDVILSFLDGYVPAPGTRFDLLHFGEDFDASQANFYVAGAPQSLRLSAFLDDGVFGLKVTAVPEPAPPVLVILSVAALLFIFCRSGLVRLCRVNA
jgi:hypothetical protein